MSLKQMMWELLRVSREFGAHKRLGESVLFENKQHACSTNIEAIQHIYYFQVLTCESSICPGWICK